MASSHRYRWISISLVSVFAGSILTIQSQKYNYKFNYPKILKFFANPIQKLNTNDTKTTSNHFNNSQNQSSIIIKQPLPIYPTSSSKKLDNDLVHQVISPPSDIEKVLINEKAHVNDHQLLALNSIHSSTPYKLSDPSSSIIPSNLLSSEEYDIIETKHQEELDKVSNQYYLFLLQSRERLLQTSIKKIEEMRNHFVQTFNYQYHVNHINKIKIIVQEMDEALNNNIQSLQPIFEKLDKLCNKESDDLIKILLSSINNQILSQVCNLNSLQTKWKQLEMNVVQSILLDNDPGILKYFLSFFYARLFYLDRSLHLTRSFNTNIPSDFLHLMNARYYLFHNQLYHCINELEDLNFFPRSLCNDWIEHCRSYLIVKSIQDILSSYVNLNQEFL